MPVTSSTAPFALANDSVTYAKMGFGALSYVAYDATSGATGVGSGTCATFNLTAAQTNFDKLIFFVQGRVYYSSGGSGFLSVNPPDTAAIQCLTGSTNNGSNFTITCVGVVVCIAGTDYTKGNAGTFTIDYTSVGSAGYYVCSLIMGCDNS